MEESNILEVNKLAVSFGETQAVDGVSFSLKKGHVLGIVGESGSGKSVTALSVMRLIASPGEIAGGEVHFRDRDGKETNLLELSATAMRRYRGNEISMIFQEPMTSLNPVYSCGEQVMESLRLHLGLSRKAARKRTLELFERVQLPRAEKLLDAYPHEVSGGQKQRVMIAMAMACNPSVLIADEPTTALDVTVQKSILSLIRELQQEAGMSVIFISHDLGVIAELADEVMVMYRGKVVEHGPVKRIFETPRHPYTQGLLACRPPLDRRLKRLPTVADFMEGKATGPEEEIATKSFETGTAPLLKIKQLKTYFPLASGWFRKTQYVKAVDDVSFDIFPGETVGLVGESGCGKTTLGRSILRLIEPTAGEIWYGGKNIRNFMPAELRAVRKDLQIIFQDPYSSLNPRIPIGKAIVEPMQVHHLHGDDPQRKAVAIDLLQRVGLGEEHFFRYPHEFSGGQRQRICIARALAVEPRFIICDESVSALDVSIQAQVLNLLKDLQDEFGFTYLFISHDLSVVRFLSDRILVMKEGKVVEGGPADQIYRSPQTAYTRQLIEAVPGS